MSDVDIRGRTILVTGASSGLGEEFARRFAGLGANLILVARRRERLQRLADELTVACESPIRVDSVRADLSTPDGIAGMIAEVRASHSTVDGVVNAAGFGGTFGSFDSVDPAEIEAQVMVNVWALTAVTRAFWPDVLQSDHGVLVNIASTASFQPIPDWAIYAASKSFVRSFTAALWDEAHAAGSRAKVLALSPGPVSTEFFSQMGTTQPKLKPMQTSEQVVQFALRQLARRRPSAKAVPGWSNWLLSQGARFVSESFLTTAAGRMVRGR